MSSTLLTALVVVPTAALVVVLFLVMWSQRSSARTARVAVVAGIVLALWAVLSGVLAWSGYYRPRGASGLPVVGVALLLALVGLAVCLGTSSSLRSLLGNQRNLIRLNVWRLEGIVFLLLMLSGQVPALWAVPAGTGDFLIGATAFWVASSLGTERGRRRAIVFNLLGMLDLVVAVGLGVMTNPGVGQVFQTTPTSELLTRFPLALVPTFLVPLAFAVHVLSLRQLAGRVSAVRAVPPATAEPLR